MAGGTRFSALHQPFEASARARPEAVALLGAEATVTYRALAERSAAVAGWLRESGTGREDLVAVCASRSPEMIAGALGVLRSGAAYLPLDPSLPEQRLAALLDDARPARLLTDRPASELPPRLEGIDIAEISQSGAADPAPAAERPTPADLAYVIYTSGSTGAPKGVLCTHGGIDNRLRWMQRAFRLTERDVVLHKTSIGFDVSVWEIFWPLSQGARLALAPAGAERDPELLGTSIRRHEVTVAHFVPAMLRAFVRSGEAARTPGLRLVVCSGEALPPELRDEFLAVSHAQLHNLYGPTEASIDVTHHRCRRGSPESRVPIGRPIDNVRVEVLGDRQEALPAGAEGEIHIGGIALARGYHRRPDLTAAAFVPDPRDPGSVLYRTGDRGRRLPNGELEYLGRRDGQIKVRGVRIELGEVEAALAALAGVGDCAVLPPGEGGGGLVGFVAGPAPAAEELRESLARRLPAQAVPGGLVRVPEIPRLASGKVDRAALRDLYRERPAAGGDGRPPRGEAELALARIWSEVLQVPRAAIGADANFFALGGDSIRSIEVVFRARTAGLRLTAQDIFRWQTLEATAAAAAAGPSGASPDSESKRPFALLAAADRRRLPAGVVGAFPLPSLLRGLMAEAAANPDYLLYTTTLTVRGRYDADVLGRSLRELVRRHPILRSALVVDGFSEPLQMVLGEVAAEVEEIDGREIDEGAWEGHFGAWIEAERRRRPDFAEPPLFRLVVHRRRGHFHLTLIEPYLDGWSMTLLLTDLLTLYDAGLSRRDPALPAPPRVTMADLAAAERRLDRAGHRAAWGSRLEGVGRSRLPRLGPGGDDPLVAPGRFPVPVSASTSRRLEELALRLGVPLKTVLLTAHVRVEAALTGSEDVVCGLMVNSRPETRDGERAIGMFLNVVPLRVGVGPSTWGDLIAAVHEAEMDVLRWRQYPYQQLLRDLGGQPPFETIFNFTRFRPYAEWRGEQVELLGIEGADQTYFGLTLQTGVALDGTVEFAVEVNPEGFSRRQVAQLVAVYKQTLEQVAEAPEARHEGQPILPPRECPRAPRRPPPSADRIETLLARRAEDAPAGTALVEGGRRCDYATLDRRAAAVAARSLAALDGRAPRRVAVRMGRSIAAMEAIFAALKLGAAFVPLDPATAPPRAESILRAARPELLIADEPPSDLAEDALPRVLVLHGEDVQVPAASGRAEPPPGDPAEPAHVLFTSGSTGQPKGVVTSHTALLNRLRWISRRFPGGDGDVYCASGAIGFVDTITALFSGLIDGVPVFLPPDPPLPPGRFAEAIAEAGVTRLTLVPSVLRDLLRELGADRGRRLLAGVRLWLLSGEPLPVALLEELRYVAPGSGVLNLYGSTEVAGDVTAHPCGDERGGHVPAGSAIDGALVQVLDRHGRDLPIGVVGEVAVSGAGLARGYLEDDQGLAGGRFEGLDDGSRRFRSGDLGRLRPDGSLELRGRLDRQLKVNGVRVEPSEVERELVGHPGVREAAVRGVGGEGGARLAAFVVGDATGPELRAFLAGRLPSALVPGVVVAVPELPRNANGKVDHERLAVPRRSGSTDPSPALPDEASVLEAWREVLDVDELGAEDDFFELGGDSLLAARVLARVEERTGIRIGLRELFDSPTPRACAARIQAARGEPRGREVVGVGD